MSSELVTVGRVGRPHGVDGSFFVEGASDAPERFARGAVLLVDGEPAEIVGRYNPQTDPSTIDLDEAKVTEWLGKGAQPSDAVAKLIKAAGINA